LIDYVMDPASDLLPETRSVLKVLAEALQQLDEKIVVLDVEIRKRAKTNALAKRLMTIPGVGAVLAAAMVAQAPAPETFRRGRDFAAWLGLTPPQHSAGARRGWAGPQRWATATSGDG
jgi:transposase